MIEEYTYNYLQKKCIDSVFKRVYNFMSMLKILHVYAENTGHYSV